MTAKRRTADQKLDNVPAGLRPVLAPERLPNEATRAELCPRHGISHNTFKKWCRLSIEGGREGSQPTCR
jgi:transposase-like protein